MNFPITQADAIHALRPGSQFVIRGEELEWYSPSISKPTKEEIQEKIKELELERERIKYKDQRRQEYPSIGDQLDALFHAGAFPPEMEAQIQAVKDKYPKT